MFLHKSNWLMRAAYPNFIWKVPPKKNTIYLTFDDGPIPEVTELVLEILEKYNAKATFFCIGDNIRKYPEIFKMLLTAGHAVGNHTFNHLNGWKTPNDTYIENIENCTILMNSIFDELAFTQPNKYFRPPYGRIKYSQSKALLPDYQVVMWDVLTGDFSQKLSPETVLKEAIKNTIDGSIVLFHDSIKANKNMSYALPRYLEHFSEQGFQFLSL